MKKSRFTEAKIVSILKELEAGTSATELGRRHGVHPNTIGNWKQKYSGLESIDLARLKQLEVEHAQMSRIIARQALELEAVRDLISKNGWSPRSAKKQ